MIGAGVLASSVIFGWATVGATGAGATTTAKPYYVSMGDSYSVGYQHDLGSTSGYTGVVATALGMQLENFGCSGATTTSIIHQIGCTASNSARTDAVPYPKSSQLNAAVAFINGHQGQIGLITVSIGGNTIRGCATSVTPGTCITAALATVESNLKALLADLRFAAGTGVPIIGVTYANAGLGAWVYPKTHPNQTLARLSAVAFQDLVNPDLQSAYQSVGGHLVDVTTATGGYTPLTRVTTLSPYGSIPTAVADACELTYYCTSGTIHANTAGYDLIGRLIASSYNAMTAGTGYWEVASDGGVYSFGTAQFYGSMGGTPLNAPVVGMASTPTGQGYWEVAADGGVFSFGTAKFYGSMGGKPLNQPIVGMAPTSTGRGYWEVASDGGVFSFGTAQFYGSMGGKPLNAPIVGLTPTPTGQGYWEVASDGGVFTFGAAQFYGSTVGGAVAAPTVGLAVAITGAGYWEGSADGDVRAFGAALYHGSEVGVPLDSPVVALTPSSTGCGYWEVAADGGVFALGTALFDGSMGGRHLNAPMVGLAPVA